MDSDDFVGFAIIAILIVIILGLIALFTVSLTGLHYQTGQGEHTGFVTAVEKEGVIWKTGTAYFKTDVSSSQEDKYCVIDDSVYARLEQASQHKEKITIQHKSYFATSVNECGDEDAIIYGVK